jgi:hypothetical protein
MPNAWVEHTRAFANANGISYSRAISDPKNKESYHAKKGGKADKPRKKKESAGMGAEDMPTAGYKGYSEEFVKDLLSKVTVKQAERKLEEIISLEYESLSRSIHTYGDYRDNVAAAYKKRYLDKTDKEKEMVLNEAKVQYVEEKIDYLISNKEKEKKWKKSQKKLLDESKTVKITRMPKPKGQDAPSQEWYDDAGNVFTKNNGRWYLVVSKDPDVFKMGDSYRLYTFYYLPNYVFVDSDGKNITKSTKGGRVELHQVEDAWIWLEEMGNKKTQSKKGGKNDEAP